MVAIDIDWLNSQTGKNLIERASTFDDSLMATSTLRKTFPDLESELIRQAIEQSFLRKRVPEGVPPHFLLTSEGLQQATRPLIAKFRAEYILKNYGKLNIVDLTCGLGFDSYFLANAGHNVKAVEQNFEIAKIAASNLGIFGIEVKCADAQNFQIPSQTDLIFVDPARRKAGGAKSILGQTKRELNPFQWSPPWDFVQELTADFKVVTKASPGIKSEFIEDWDAIWISADRDLVETMLISKGTGKRSALIIAKDNRMFIDGGIKTKPSPIGKYLIVPNSALIRANALNYLAEKLSAGLVNKHIAWLTTDAQIAADFEEPSAQVFEIEEICNLNERELAKKINSRGTGSLTITTRGVDIDPEILRKKVLKNAVKGGPETVLAIFRDDKGPVVLICRRLTKGN